MSHIAYSETSETMRYGSFQLKKMTKTYLLFIFLLLSQIIVGQSIELEELEGKWYVNMTTFPMWLKGDKTNPTFNYTIEKRGKTTGLRDDVQYLKSGKTKSIIGFDKAVNDKNSKFIWRGKGILGLFKSKWEILYFDKEKEIIVLRFEKTLFTPAGYDVISRQPNLSESEIEYFKKMGTPGLDIPLEVLK